MAKVTGRLGFAAISTDGGTVYANIGSSKTVKLGSKRATIKRTTHDSGDNEEYGAGRKDATLSVDCAYDEADTGQAACWTSYEAGTTVWFRFRPDTGSGKKQYRQQGIITDMSDDSPNDDDNALSIQIQLSGTRTTDTQ